MKVNYTLLAIVFILVSPQTASSQTIIKGTVYTRRDGTPLQGVSVLAISGAGTSTDSLGRYSIPVTDGDSIFFSWLGKVTDRFPAKNIRADESFDINLDEVNVHSLPAILVNGRRDYFQDSLKNRELYQKVFGYESKSGPQDKDLNQLGGVGLGFDLDNMFSPSADNHTQALQQKLMENEQDKYIDHKFNRTLVKRVTRLEPPALDSFMKTYRPSFELLHRFETDYEYYQWILDEAKFFREQWNLQSAFRIFAWQVFFW